MSGIGGKKREVKSFGDFAKYVGLFKGRVVLVNPDRQRLNKLLGKENSDDDKDIDYTGEKDGIDTARITFWLEVEGKEGIYVPHTITLRNEIRVSEKTNKIQLINCVGDTTWVEADENLDFDPETIMFDSFKYFTNVTMWQLPSGDLSEKYKKGAKPAPDGVEYLGEKNYRPALIGEEELAEFMKTWLAGIDFKDVDANILLDTKKLFAGNFKELQLVDSDFDREFVALAYVRVDDEDTDKQYQKVFKKFLPANFMKFINNGCKFPNTFSQDTWDKWLKEVDDEYGVDGHYVLEPLKEYNPNDDFATKGTKADGGEVTATNNKY